MSACHLTVGSIFRAHGREFLARFGEAIPAHQRRALRSLSLCRTKELGGHVVRCPECGYEREHYNSCYCRGCPQCEGSKEAAWLLERESELLPTPYYHVVFPLPHVFNELLLENQRVGFSLFFQAVAYTLKNVARRKLGGELGFFCVLHTWGQLLTTHFHLHCVVPGGVMLPDGRWKASSQKGRYLLPEKALLLVFKGVFLRLLRRALAQGKLRYSGNFEELLYQAGCKRWTMHTEPPFGSPLHMLKYLSRYTRKVALSNSRLVSLNDGMVEFTWKDYANNCEKKVCRLNAIEFIRRFLSHIPPPGFVRIRHYGFMVGKKRKERLAALKDQILWILPKPIPHPVTDGSFQPGKCPECKRGALLIVAGITKAPKRRDSS